jgi:Lrp/AsnC family transcriptional regulator for asnA, asnC and gidA
MDADKKAKKSKSKGSFALTRGFERQADIDELDRKVLSVLSKNARASARAIARELEVSPTLVLDRIQRLEQSKFILGYRVEVDPAAAGYGVTATIGIKLHGDADIDEALEYLMGIREVQVAVVVASHYDLLVSVSAKDMKQYTEVVLNKIRRIPGFMRSESMIGLVHMRRIGGRFSFVWTGENDGTETGADS